ncbi:MAG TPA: group III truncated hemoglobin [Saprospiraceae bacterium]|nr:group III truncated hemoglobin [Saprospiraceae bacterium]HNL39057.1 group III truncated hemoglobin [Saprospiraceae bacterium]HNM24251.1 group III truncated hemoglobin [Saprospiraceae bacterium]
MTDIVFAEDVRKLVDTFYEKVRRDDVIGFIFNEVAQINWPEHLPRMYAFWEFLLLSHDTYKGNPLEKHWPVHEKTPFTAAHFDRWVALFRETVDELFAGPVAEDAKFRAFAIAETWKPKFTGVFGP